MIRGGKISWWRGNGVLDVLDNFHFKITFFFFFATSCSMWGLSSPLRDRVHVARTGRWSLNHQGSPILDSFHLPF